MDSTTKTPEVLETFLKKCKDIMLKQEPDSRGRLSYLDGWRGLAISIVLISHFLAVSKVLPFHRIDIGRFGVDIFFVLSAMLMANILFIKKMDLSTFYKRRVSRIFPVLVTYIVLVYAISAALGLGSTDEWKNFFYTLFSVRGYITEGADLWNTGYAIGHLWSLNAEEHVYLVFGGLAFLASFGVFSILDKKESIGVVLITLGVASILLKYSYAVFPSIKPEGAQFRTEIIASHMLISAGYFLLKDWIWAALKNWFGISIPSWLPLIAFLLAMSTYSWFAPWQASFVLSPFLLSFTVNHLDKMPSFVNAILTFKPLRYLGIWSYSIYLLHYPFYIYGVKYGDSPYVAGPPLLFLSIVIGALSFYIFENPARTYLNKKKWFKETGKAVETSKEVKRPLHVTYKPTGN
ncbi:acyltransferase [Candidatus Gracilibacteria bacterium 28_42_T64]|nr:acyltransferase [Candidatus Gracilibacteria bacterium 28_42_T64]